MADNIFYFHELAGSGRGLKAKPNNPDGSVAVLSNIASITWAAHVKGNGTAFATGTLTVADVMQTAATTSDDDPNFEYTFLWACPGTNWPTAGVTYRQVVTFTPTSGSAYKHVWEVAARSATGA